MAPDEENLAVSVTLSAECSRRLLPEAERPVELTQETFAALRERYLALAPSVSALLAESGESIPAQRVLVSLNRENELHYLFLYAADTRPARLRMAYLADQPAGAFCEFSDDRVSPPRRAVLQASALLHSFIAPATPRP